MDAARLELIAHRGYPLRYPENTLIGVTAALDAGARFVEIDVQLSADEVPVLLHDETLDRTTGVEGLVGDRSLAALRKLDAGESARFGDRFRWTSIPTLAETAALLAAWPGAVLFVDVKPHGIERVGAATVIAGVCEALGAARGRCVVTCSDAAALAEARACGAASVAWVLEAYDEGARGEAARIGPDYIFCDRAMPSQRDEPLWPGPWRWAVYGVDRAADALELAARGAALIETMALPELREELAGRGGAPRAA